MPMDRSDKSCVHPRIRLSSETYADSEALYHVTICSLDGQPLFQRRELALAVVDSVFWFRDVRKAKVYAFCAMPDHLHMLVSISCRRPPFPSHMGLQESLEYECASHRVRQQTVAGQIP
jgi:REP element-mobilizing transposase RayT